MVKPRAKARKLLTRFKIGKRVYELVPFHKKGEGSVRGDTMVERAQELGANLGEKDGAFVLKHQDEIPEEFRGKFCLVFAAWRDPADPRFVVYLSWSNCHWFQSLHWLNNDWDDYIRLVRRVK